MKDLSKIREEIDALDDIIVDSYLKRMELSGQVARIKKESQKPVLDSDREREILSRITENVPVEYQSYIKELYKTIFTSSKLIQSSKMQLPIPSSLKSQGENDLNGSSAIKFALIGEKLSHSYSADIHKKMGLDYSLLEIKKGELSDFIKNNEYTGINVTIPYKKDIVPYLDELSEEAKAIGSVNTVLFKGGKSFGYNTDIYGLKYLFIKNKVSVSNKNVLILGSGGASATAKYFAVSNNAKSVSIVSRNGAVNYSNCYDLSDTEIIINTTPVGMYPNVEDCPIDLSRFKKLEFLADIIYNPLRTSLIISAQKSGIKCDNGLSMLVYQGLMSESIWLSDKSPLNSAEKIFNELNKSKKNIVLCGMPSSGKSSIGKLLAEKLNKEFVDTDVEIEKQFGSPSSIIESQGESKFRDIEEKVIKELSLKNNLVIATGGGAVQRENNVNALKHNGFIIYLKRNLQLLTDKNRPLSKSVGIENLYVQRKDIYESVNDACVENNSTKENAVREIIKIYENSCN